MDAMTIYYIVMGFYWIIFCYIVFRLIRDRHRYKGKPLYIDWRIPRHRHPDDIRRGRNEEVNLLNFEEYIKQISKGD